jgi:UDP-2-acetamido-3-amino-2,3-dideoxy-glucuronate N-acetyltransferase
MHNLVTIHPSATVSPDCKIGEHTKVWVNVQIREGASIGANTILSKDVYIDTQVQIGSNVKVQNGVSIYKGVTVEDDVFIGPHAAFTNDFIPRAFNSEWKITPTLVRRGASIGANATIVCGVEIGEYAMVGAGSVVTKNVPPYTLVVGNPARAVTRIDKAGHKIQTVK